MAIRFTGALRQHFSRAGRGLYQRIPTAWRESVVDFCYRHAGPIFQGFPSYELWRGSRPNDLTRSLQCDHNIRLIDITTVAPLGLSPGRIAIHAHLYYQELADELAAHLRQMPYNYDLFLSLTHAEGWDHCKRLFSGLPNLSQLRMELVENRGRDIAPMLCSFGDALREYDFIAHIHTKKSLYSRGATDGWREYLLHGLFGDTGQIKRILALLNQGVGLVYPQSYHRVPYAGSSWMANRRDGLAWCRRLGIRCPPSGYFHFPVGSMFWARADALRPLLDAGLKPDDFDAEAGQNDGTLAHVVERLIGIVAKDSGRLIAILRDRHRPSWSPWRLEQYLHRPASAQRALVSGPDVDLVVFDVFDTLLTRPLTEPAQIHAIVARNAGPTLGKAYLAWRAEAERQARAQAGGDIGLQHIGAALQRLAGLDQAQADRLIALEINAELAALAPRRDAQDLFQSALDAGKTLVIASDTVLDSATVEKALHRHGFAGWQRLYLSSETGLRKDSGVLFEHILHREGVAAGRAIMVGDDEHADLQVPGNAGWHYLHLVRPADLGRSLTKMAPMIEAVECAADPDAQVAIGLVLRGTVGRLHYDDGFDSSASLPQPDLRGIGYAICGPLLFAFSQWLLERARHDGMQRLYFLAREGELLKIAYDRISAGQSDAPDSAYLVLSRRALNVPSIQTLDDAMAIAKPHHAPAPLESFLAERYGVSLDPAVLQDLCDRGIWGHDRLLEIPATPRHEIAEVLQALMPQILAQANAERPAMLAYLEQMAIGIGRHGVVDVGFSGTIQRRLNALFDDGISGYYMATLANANDGYAEPLAHGAFHDAADMTIVPGFIKSGFILEKLLSADAAQVLRYHLDEQGPQPEFRALSPQETAVFALRAQVRAGAMHFIDEALDARTHLLPDFRFPVRIAAQLFERFVAGLSPREAELMSQILLDDHYCGRGVVE